MDVSRMVARERTVVAHATHGEAASVADGDHDIHRTIVAGIVVGGATGIGTL